MNLPCTLRELNISIENDFKINPLLHREPKQIDKDRGNVIVFAPFGDDTSRMILMLLKLGYELLRNTKH